MALSLFHLRRKNIDSLKCQHQPTIGSRQSDYLPKIFEPYVTSRLNRNNLFHNK